LRRYRFSSSLKGSVHAKSQCRLRYREKRVQLGIIPEDYCFVDTGSTKSGLRLDCLL
jgi:hypothetical protein